MRESAISLKWTIITITIAVTLFFHFISLGGSQDSVNIIILMGRPGPIFFAVSAITFFNATLRNLVVLIGSKLDKN